ncbi:MAG: hypothetical protein PHD54_16185 [Desulfuromonadaceae bacterium]|nr:hypothetical protein [Desulfuromonadaceae bacterium]
MEYFRVMIRLSFVAIIVGLLCGCGENSSTGQEFTTLLKSSTGGSYNTNEVPSVTVLRNQSDFDVYWRTKTNQTSPAVNFNENLVVSVADKTYPIANYRIYITKIEPTTSGATVYATVVGPGKNCMLFPLIDKPYHIVSTPIFSGNATLNLSQTSDIDCAPPRE